MQEQDPKKRAELREEFDRLVAAKEDLLVEHNNAMDAARIVDRDLQTVYHRLAWVSTQLGARHD